MRVIETKEIKSRYISIYVIVYIKILKRTVYINLYILKIKRCIIVIIVYEENLIKNLIMKKKFFNIK